jgi:hypothetical protein
MDEQATGNEVAAHGEALVRIAASVLDVGLAGLAIETETRLPPELPTTVTFGAENGEIALDGRVVWCFFHGTDAAPSGEQRPVYRAGIEFSNVLTPAAERLVAFLEQQAAPSGETRLFGRFRPAPAEPIRIHVTTAFRCREVETATAAVEIRLGFDPAPGGAVELVPRGAERSVETTIIEAKRGEAAESWELVLAVGDAEAGALAALRHVVYN